MRLLGCNFVLPNSTYKGGIEMKPISRILNLVVCILVGIVVFALLFNLTKPTQPRIPSPEYATLAEEYIDAIETFNRTGEVVVPMGARFSYDGKIVIIRDIDSGAYVTCDFVLNGTVPIYDYTYYTSVLPAFFSTLFGAIAAFACYAGISSCYEKRKYKALNKIKSEATYGDDRHISYDCLKCYKKDYCKCISCPYATKCGRCPTTDCIEIFEDMLQENITSEDSSPLDYDEYDDMSEEMSEHYKCDNCEDSVSEETSESEEVSEQCECDDCEDSISEETSKSEEASEQCDSVECKDTVEEPVEKCDDCDKATSCECNDCYYIWSCDECPSENCVEEAKAKVKQSYGDSSVHTLDETVTAFQCTPDCSNFGKCECLHGCNYVSECHKCPYPGCTHDIEMKLLGLDIPD